MWFRQRRAPTPHGFLDIELSFHGFLVEPVQISRALNILGEGFDANFWIKSTFASPVVDNRVAILVGAELRPIGLPHQGSEVEKSQQKDW